MDDCPESNNLIIFLKQIYTITIANSIYLVIKFSIDEEFKL